MKTKNSFTIASFVLISITLSFLFLSYNSPEAKVARAVLELHEQDKRTIATATAIANEEALANSIATATAIIIISQKEENNKKQQQIKSNPLYNAINALKEDGSIATPTAGANLNTAIKESIKAPQAGAMLPGEMPLVIGQSSAIDGTTEPKPTAQTPPPVVDTGKKLLAIQDELTRRGAPAGLKAEYFTKQESRGCDSMVILAICAKDSGLGTKGRGAETHNCGNVGNTETATQGMDSWEQGVDAVCNTLNGKQKWVTMPYQLSAGAVGNETCKKMNGEGCYASNPSGDYGATVAQIINRLNDKYHIYAFSWTSKTKFK